ncbi:MAG: GtrA family protein [Candidatus Nomurabacteria bacterium]|jgi:putative flippase GtrA|nr:GtrA family protein [Candidatus Nomurabacteria bacterium]
MKISETIAKHFDKLKFGLVGLANTALDFSILNVLSLFFGLPAIAANTISTGISMIFSFFVNKKWVFNSKGKNYAREIVLFFVFTAIGMWIINNGIVQLLVSTLPPEISEFWRINIAKIIATLASMIWNYVTYKRFVFKNNSVN